MSTTTTQFTTFVNNLLRRTTRISNDYERKVIQAVLHDALSGKDHLNVTVPRDIFTIPGGQGYNSGTRGGRMAIVRHSYSNYESLLIRIKKYLLAQAHRPIPSKDSRILHDTTILSETSRSILHNLLEAYAVIYAENHGIRGF